MPPTDTLDTAAGPLRIDRCGDLSALRQAFDGAGYSPSHLFDFMKSCGSSAESTDLPVALRRSAEPTLFHTLVRLFVLGQPVSTQAAQAALGTQLTQALSGIGLLVAGQGGLRSVAKVMPLNQLWVLSDFRSDVTGQGLAGDHVLGAGVASATLAGFTVRRPVAAALDIGAGSGVQSFLAARHAQRVVGTDINQRALNFAAFGAALNGVENAQFRTGSLFEPVAGERFDLIVSNPPFVISPESRYEYRDGGLEGDSISKRILQSTPGYLNEGGVATIMFNWHHKSQDDWSDRPFGWLDGAGYDVWLLRFYGLDPLSYAAKWIDERDTDQYAQQIDRWVAYFQELGVGQISAGVVILRKRSGASNWRRCDALSDVNHLVDCSDQIERVIAAQDLLSGLADDRRLLDARLVVAGDHRLRQELGIENGGWALKGAVLEQTMGLPFPCGVDGFVAGMVAGCDGKRSVRDLVDQVVQRVGEPPDAVIPACVGAVKKLLRCGLLAPVVSDGGIGTNGGA